MLVNLDQSESFNSWGEIGESFFSGSPSRLEPRLSATPAEFPDCDTLIFPFKPGGHMEYHDLYFPKTAAPSLDSALTNLAVETIHEIYSHMDDLPNVMSLSMTFQVLWEIGKQEIYRCIRLTAVATSDSYSWAGDRIICVGDYLRNNDMPENMLTPEDI
ncbi:hypothetical protein DFH09DRAFT_1318424 [Mycena vulgaris]|nr:hypothetical protein DFH09DRAFT_1318424 [Mycena vulgaris]